MSTQADIVDTCIHQWTVDLDEMKDMVPQKWQQRLSIKAKLQDPVSGTLVPTLPWTHAYWNEDTDEYERPPDAYTNSAQYRSPDAMEAHLEAQGVRAALLTGHVVKFFPALKNEEYKVAIATAYNELLKRRWLADSDVLKGAILVNPNKPEAAIAEIEKYADDPDFVTVLMYGGEQLTLGHEFYHPVYEAVADSGMPLTIHTSGNPIHRQTAMGRPIKYVTYDTNLVHNHMSNLTSFIYQGVFDKYPELTTVWAGEGVEWILQPLWRAARFHRNEGLDVPDIAHEPEEYIREHCYLTTYPLGRHDTDAMNTLYEMVGFDRILYGSGYPHWNGDVPDDVASHLSDERRAQVFTENPHAVYGV